jgi:hypothetical protein
MANINEEARIPVYINDEQAKSALRNLQSEANKWRKAMYDAMSAGDMKGMKEAERELKKTNQQMNELKKASFDVNKVLDNLSTASVKDLRKTLSLLKKEQEGLTRGTKEYLEVQKKIDSVKGEFGKINGQIVQQQGLLGKLKNVAGGLLPAFGWGAISAGAVMAFNKIISSTDFLSTKWAVFIGGLKEATNEFWRTLGTGDWSNFLTNLREAVRVGREYEAVLDELEAKQRGLSIAESDSKRQILDLEDIVRNASLSNKERIDAAEKRIKIEEDLSAKRTKIAKEEFENELMMTAQSTKLSEERLMELIADIDSETKAKAEAYLAQKEELTQLNNAYRKGATERQRELQAELDLTSNDIKAYAEDLVKIGNATDDQLNKTVEAYGKVKDAESSALENTKRVRSAMYSIIDEENRNEENSRQKLADAIIKIESEMTEAIADEADARKAIMESLAEAEKLMLEVTEEEYRNAIDNIKEFSEALNRELEDARQLGSDALNTPDAEFTSVNQVTAHYENRRAVLEQQYEKERMMAAGNKDALLEIEKQYHLEMNQLLHDEVMAKHDSVQRQIDYGRAYISELSGIVGEQSKLGKALFLFDQALAIANIWVQSAQTSAAAYFAALRMFLAAGPMAPGLAAVYSAPAIAASKSNAALNTGLIALQTVGGLVGKKSGGYASTGSDDNVAGYYHANEFIASAPAVRNPTVKPILDIIDMAQRTGRIATLNLPVVLAGGGKQSGGYASGSSSSSSSTTNNYYQGNPELLRAIEKLNANLEKGIKAKLFYRDFEDFEKEVDDIRDAASI